MGREDQGQLSSAKRAYRNAAQEGNRQEEARWANVIGDILKNRGEYVEALKWLRIDYEVSIKYLPEKQLLPTCQSLGEVYLRLQHFKDALIYQKKHLELAKDTNDLVEQQRACTQLGRTYHELFLKSSDDHCSVRNAKKYFVSAMKIAGSLMENPTSNKSMFLKEYIDAHNNIGMLEMDLDNLEEAQRILTKGLQICDEEEVVEDDDGRTRLHHNLGNVYMELRKWDKAREHIEKDIIICKRIDHCQGEAKGYINLGELHYRVQKYEEANLCYQKARDLAKSMEDEDALVSQIDQNIEIVKQAMEVMEELKKEEQCLKKLTRNMGNMRGTSGERKCLLQQIASLDRLIEKSSMIFAWRKHCEFAKKKKQIASELCDKEKLGDSFLAIGESYQKLRNFNKALKWYTKAWETYNSIGSLEGQALAKINIGDVLDSSGNWANALEAFTEGYRIACQANLPAVQLDALENMHYSQMIRFDNVEEARRLQSLVDKIKLSNTRELETVNMPRDCCSETETEEDESLSKKSDMSYSPKINKSSVSEDELKDDMPLISFLRANEYPRQQKTAGKEKSFTTRKPSEASSTSITRSTGSYAGRKHCRLVLSDDEDENEEVQCAKGRVRSSPQEDVATSYEFKSRHDLSSPAHRSQDISPVAAKYAIAACTPALLEESTSYKSRTSKLAIHSERGFRFSSASGAVKTPYCDANGLKSDAEVFENIGQQCDLSGREQLVGDDKYCASIARRYRDINKEHIIFKIEDDFVHLERGKFKDKVSIGEMKVEVACLYFLQLVQEKRSRGLLPIIGHINCGGGALDSLVSIDTLKDYMDGNNWIEVSIDAWLPKRLMKLYVECCEESSEPPNMKMLKKLYKLEVSEDEIIISDCELQDVALTPLLKALYLHKTVAVLDLSHNLLGNETMEKLQQVFMTSSQKYGGLVLDLHCNRFGPTALFQICECPVLFARLEVLNISGNRLTDGCASYLVTILQNCKALYSLNIERCSITSRTIQKIAESLDSGSILSQIAIGYNSPISGNSIVYLLNKLATIKSLSGLSLNGLKLSKYAIDSLCKLVKTSCFSELMIADSSIVTDDALQLMESWANETREQVKIDLSSCLLTSEYVARLDAEVSLINGILELNLGGNPIRKEGGIALASLLKKPECCLRVLTLCKCQLGLSGVLIVLQALTEESPLEELDLSENALEDDDHTLLSIEEPEHDEGEKAWDELFTVNTDFYPLEVADSEDEQRGVRPFTSGLDGSCTSSLERNHCNLTSPFIRELSMAIHIAKQLRVLNLSNNGFSEQVAELFYAAWSKSLRGSSTRKHILGQTIHFSAQEKQCCGMKPCCRRL